MPRWHIFFLKGETLRDECLFAYTAFKRLQIQRVEAPFHIAEYHLPLVSRWNGGNSKMLQQILNSIGYTPHKTNTM